MRRYYNGNFPNKPLTFHPPNSIITSILADFQHDQVKRVLLQHPTVQLKAQARHYKNCVKNTSIFSLLPAISYRTRR